MGDRLGLGGAVDGDDFGLRCAGMQCIEQAWEDWPAPSIDVCTRWQRRPPLLTPCDDALPEDGGCAGAAWLIALDGRDDGGGINLAWFPQVARRDQAGGAGGKIGQHKDWHSGHTDAAA